MGPADAYPGAAVQSRLDCADAAALSCGESHTPVAGRACPGGAWWPLRAPTWIHRAFGGALRRVIRGDGLGAVVYPSRCRHRNIHGCRVYLVNLARATSAASRSLVERS